MNRINIHGIEPGPYVDDQGFNVVVLDIVDHSWNSDKQLMEYLVSPLVVCRELLGGEKRYAWPVEMFKMKFRKI